MDFFFLRQDLFSHSQTIEIIGHSQISSEFKWLEGKRFTSSVPNLILELDSKYGSSFPDFFDTSIPVMSKQLFEALQRLDVNIEGYPVVLKNNSDKSEHLGYYAINIIGIVDAIDTNKTIAERIRFGKPYFNSSIFIHPESTKGLNAFRLVGGPSFIVVNEVIAKAIEKQKFNSVLLQKTSDYKGC